MAELNKGAWMVPWTESERGWGTRPDGYWYYASKAAAERDTQNQLTLMRMDEATRYGGSTPDLQLPGRAPVRSGESRVGIEDRGRN